MSQLTALPLRGPEQVETESLEQLVLLCLESLAGIARDSGQRQRAERLFDAASVLRDEPCSSSGANSLSEREWQVGTLVSRGLSNREIANELVVSERTVDSHVSHILRKLSLMSRAQIAAWVVQQRRQFRVVGQST